MRTQDVNGGTRIPSHDLHRCVGEMLIIARDCN
jgi:hypothetical protein